MIVDTSPVYVQYTADTPPKILAIFSSPQDPEIFPGIVEMQDDDPIYLAWFNPPPDYLAIARAELDRLLALAGLRISPLQDAVDLDVADAAELALLTKWKQYRVAVNRVQQQAGWPAEINWPSVPE